MRILLFIFLGLSLMGVALAAEKAVKHQIVFEMTSEGDKQFEAVLNNVENVMKALGHGTEVVVITHGPGIGLVLRANAAAAQRVEKLSKAGAAFVACENTMKKKQISKDQLLPFVKTVDSGVAEVVRRQEAGWSYVKSGH